MKLPDTYCSVASSIGQIAKVGAGAFSKAWKRGGGQAVLLSCHYDVLDWIEPDVGFVDGEAGKMARPA